MTLSQREETHFWDVLLTELHEAFVVDGIWMNGWMEGREGTREFQVFEHDF